METDSDFGDDLSAAEAKEFSGVFRLLYEDAGAVRTRRTIERCRHLTVPPHEYVLAHCRLRGDERLFRLDRILELVDDSSGEVLDEIAGTRIGDAYEPITSVYSPDDPVRSGRFDLHILTFVASLSSKMRDSQVATIADYLVDVVGVPRGPNLAQLIKRHRVPGPEEFRQAVKAIPSERADRLIAAAEAVLQKVRRNSDLDRGIIAMLRARRVFFGKYGDGY